MLRNVLVLLAVGFLAVAPRAARATPLAQSTFTADAEKWMVGTFGQGTTNMVPPDYFGTGGNPGGFIRWNQDIYGHDAFCAPFVFLGDMSSAYGGTLHIDQRANSDQGIVKAPLVLLGRPYGAALYLRYQAAPPEVGTWTGPLWTEYDIPLLASAGWEASEGGNAYAPATEAQFRKVLLDLQLLHITASWHAGSDPGYDVGLDNVRLESSSSSVPEPGSLSLWTLAGVAIGAMVRRRKQQT